MFFSLYLPQIIEGKYGNDQVTKCCINQPHIGLLFQIYLPTDLNKLFIFTLTDRPGLSFVIMNALSLMVKIYYQ